MSNGTSSVAPPGLCTPPPAIRRMRCLLGPGPRRWLGRGRNAEPLRARLDEVTEVGGADSRGRAVPDRTATVTEQGVPGQVEGPLHWLAVDRRQTAAGVRDRPDQAGAGHRPPVVAVRVPPGGRPQLIALRAVGEPAVLHPAAADQGVRGGDERSDLVQFGQLRGGTIPARQVAPQLALLRPARQPVLRGARLQQFGGSSKRAPWARLSASPTAWDSASQGRIRPSVAVAGVTAPPRATSRSAGCRSLRCRRATRWVSGGSRRRRRARSLRPRGRSRWRRPPWPTRR